MQRFLLLSLSAEICLMTGFLSLMILRLFVSYEVFDINLKWRVHEVQDIQEYLVFSVD